jgi:hypothetical protein
MMSDNARNMLTIDISGIINSVTELHLVGDLLLVIKHSITTLLMKQLVTVHDTIEFLILLFITVIITVIITTTITIHVYLLKNG